MVGPPSSRSQDREVPLGLLPQRLLLHRPRSPGSGGLRSVLVCLSVTSQLRQLNSAVAQGGVVLLKAALLLLIVWLLGSSASMTRELSSMSFCSLA